MVICTVTTMTHWRLKWLAFFSNKVFLIKVCTLFFKTQDYCILNRLQYSVNNFCNHWETKQFMWLAWSWYLLYRGGLELNLQCLWGLPTRNRPQILTPVGDRVIREDEFGDQEQEALKKKKKIKRRKGKEKNYQQGTSLVEQWLRIRLPMQGTQVQALVREDPTCCGGTKPVCHNYWACALQPVSHNYWAPVLQLLKPMSLEPVLHYKRSHCNERPVHCNEE